MKKHLPIIGITMGDPKGIGPEVIRKALKNPQLKGLCTPVVFGDPEYFDWKKARRLSPVECGRLSGHYIRRAAHAVLSGQIDAIVTAPISKDHLRQAGYPYPGHTEFLANLAGITHYRMMMAGPRLKAVLVTIHEPLSTVASHLTIAAIARTIELTHRALKDWFGIRKPRIAVAALNPHAGEEGMFGTEELRSISPAVHQMARKRIQVSGPLPPDTVFLRALRGEFDAVVAMYHDQGLIPVKLLHFEEAVNITLGLPFIRTSVDHGTAFDIAGKNKADPTNMIAAIEMAVRLIHKGK